MPKKSNKTAHVLSLLTNGVGESSGESIPVNNPEIANSASSSTSTTIAQTLKSEVVVEMQDDSSPNCLSDLVKCDLEKELAKEANKKSDISSVVVTSDNERPPYSPTFMAKFGIEPPVKESEIPLSLDQVKSEDYILEDFNDENEEETVLMEDKNMPSAEFNADIESTRVLHNIAEQVVRAKAPEIMKGLNMCCCDDCVYDVIALALNHITPLYTVTVKGQLFQKLASYETQYGTDLTSEITKACMRVKLNPSHEGVRK